MVMPRIATDETAAAAGAETEEGRRPPLVSAPAAASPELVDRPRRRTFKAEDKLRILAEVDRAAGTPGAIGALLRREGLYSSTLTEWRHQREAGAYNGLNPVKRGPKAATVNPLPPPPPCRTAARERTARAPARARRSRDRDSKKRSPAEPACVR